MDKDWSSDGLPQYSQVDQFAHVHRRRHFKRRVIRLLVLACVGYAIFTHWQSSNHTTLLSTERLQSDYATCASLRQVPSDPSGHRERNARFVDGQKPILIRNATVWTGEPSSEVSPEEARKGKGYSWVRSDVLLQDGLIKSVKSVILDSELPGDIEVINAHGRPLTAGIIDMHSHTGVDSLPSLEGGEDTNELSSDITPFVRSLDGFNPLDPQIQVIKSGGVTTSLILPGSGNNIGGEAYVIKHSVGKKNGRPELSIQDLLADPDRNWRYMKMACGENAKSVYGRVGRNFGPFSRLGEAWYFRHAFEEATKLKNAQDDWCAAADRFGAENMDSYLPTDLKWESLSAVMRGQVMVNTHCYTIPDLESYIGYTNEFKFPIRAFHHAHATYLVPEVLKRAYGGRPPAAALFADNMYYKTESYVASEQAGKVLYEAGLTPVYVSDNPVLNAQHVVLEAAKAYKNGLPYHAALAGVTSASAELLGLGERVGKVKPGFDGDVVLWDSDPLSLGATPLQVFIDGVPQFDARFNLTKPLTPPLEHFEYQDHEQKSTENGKVVLTGVKAIQLPGHEQVLESSTNVVVASGSITCIGECAAEVSSSNKVIGLENGYIAPSLTAFGSLLGLEEISAEDDTSDGANSQDSFSAAIDGLTFEGKNIEAAYAHGVTKAITAPKFGYSGHKGLSAGFRLGANHALEKNAVFNPTVALHYTLTLSAKQGKTPTLSSAIDDLRTKLLKPLHSPKKPSEKSLENVLAGTLPLVIDVHSADTIASLLRLKAEIDAAIHANNTLPLTTTPKLNLILFGAAESHLLAPALASANVSVILSPLFSYATTWEQRRALTGAPLTNGTAIDVLHAAGVKVAIGVDEDWEARDLYLQAGIVAANSQGRISEREALGLVSKGIFEVLGLQEDEGSEMAEFVVFEGNPLTTRSRVRAVADGRGGLTVWS
ncbi:hypothetical protein M409DRAFT_49603 [Zasmidium cellare ATCC 36951]|uniref:Amidohydrolase-related domain-containing protein n=1 Tax=Zasmidium cellare ATCC 36951 TaxID=1080233 RepID=A0A6A6D1Q5_ZASCE|nr:uncharacterized protein M409DRAFT_49603 [Zasmidium cellare ATCC 36951]KAF2173115.1 hypothetical protein M409DRAFT_49603 [Zasmidium cellare ATCC 36951]